MDLIDREEVILALVEKGQSSKRFKVGDIWQLNFEEIRECINAIPVKQVKMNHDDLTMKYIVFSNIEVKNILDGHKTMFREPIKPKYKGRLYPIWEYPDKLIFEKIDDGELWQIWNEKKGSPYTCVKPQYKKGDVLQITKYPYDNHYIKIYNVHAERLQEISDEDVIKEGYHDALWFPHVDHFQRDWNKGVNRERYGWDKNPWVWVYEFEQTLYTDMETGHCEWCSNLERDHLRIEFAWIDSDYNRLESSDYPTQGLAKYCPACGRQLPKFKSYKRGQEIDFNR